MESIRHIALVVNKEKPGASEAAAAVRATTEQLGLSVKETDVYPLSKDFLRDCDAAAVIGGDGTLLSVISQAVTHDVPVFGINQGKLGFLATFSPDAIERELRMLSEGQYRIETRGLLSAKGNSGLNIRALNDIVIKNAHGSRMINLRVYCDDELVTRYTCDGLILATPTGSTAYNLSADGPIVHPVSNVLIMTPICPHTLSNRSLILPGHTSLRVELEDEQEARVTIDGRTFTEFGTLPIEVSVCQACLKLIHKTDQGYFKILRSKLHWGGENAKLEE